MTTNAFGVSKRDYAEKTRKKLAGKGDALKDGSFPIKNKTDLEHAEKMVGLSKHPDAAKRLIARRAKEMGVSKGVGQAARALAPAAAGGALAGAGLGAAGSYFSGTKNKSKATKAGAAAGGVGGLLFGGPVGAAAGAASGAGTARLVAHANKVSGHKRALQRRAKVAKVNTDSKNYKALIWNKDVTGKSERAKTNRKIYRRARLAGQAVGAVGGAAAGAGVGAAVAGKEGAVIGGIGGSVVGQNVGDYVGARHAMNHPNYKPKGSTVKKNAFGVEVHKGLFGAVADVAKPVKAAQAVTKMPAQAAGALKKVGNTVTNAPAALHRASTQMGMKATPMAMSGGVKGKVGSGIQHAAGVGMKTAQTAMAHPKAAGAIGAASATAAGAMPFAAGRAYQKRQGKTGF